MDKSRILVTGATGFLGSLLCKRLASIEHYKLYCTHRKRSNLSVLSQICDKIELVRLDDPRRLADAVEGINNIDAIIHCATNYGRGSQDPNEQIEANLVLPLQLIQLGSQLGIKVFINTDTYLDKGVDYYSLSKKQFAEWLRFFAERINCANVVIEHFFGPSDDQTKFVSWLIRCFLDKVPEIELTEGRQRRDFVYIDDVVEAFVHVLAHSLHKKLPLTRYEVGSGYSVPIRHFVELVQSLCDGVCTKLNFGSVPYRKNEPMEASIDLSALYALGWKPNVTLVDGLRRTIEHEKKARLVQ